MMRDISAPAPSVAAPPAEPSGDGGPGRGIFSSLRAHPILIAFVTLLTVATTLAASAARESTYEAEAQILVTPIPETERSLPQLPLLRASSDRTRVAQTAANLLDSPAAAELAAEQLGTGWTADRVAAATDILPEGESDILAVTAEADDPDLAARVANAFAESTLVARHEAVAPILESRIAQLEDELQAEPDPSAPAAVDLAERLATLRALRSDEGDPTLSLTQLAEAPTSAVGPSRSLLVIVSVLAGFVLGLGIAIVVDMLSPRAGRGRRRRGRRDRRPRAGSCPGAARSGSERVDRRGCGFARPPRRRCGGCSISSSSSLGRRAGSCSSAAPRATA